ncbi:tumor necrosis factor ligand superfamily member 13B isoform 1-T3 [Salvelinus alpinus]|uniref:TNF superfamily member 13b n=1 Tax=Salmo trutta TaxID=8032 RepID=A0A673XS13_SALTR|nr:tumor necrosis factor ligand superfamily member 13B-like [Salmo trutta]XP_029558665.1 tumor necrosis factor ligand superfamily member 13B-like [Salmo trutta]
MASAGPNPEGGGPASGQESGGRRLSWLVLLLTLAAVTSSSLSALSLYHLLALRAEVEELRSEVFRRREEQQEARHGETLQQMSSRARRSSPDPPHPPDPQPGLSFVRKRSVGTGTENSVSQPCLQMLADSNRKTFQKEFALEPYTGIPWQAGLRRGSALEAESDSILVREEGYYFVYSQVYYMDTTFAMGHVVIRKKRNVVGDEAQHVTLFRCIQNMNPVYPYNTCYTGGIVKLEVGDSVELLIPRSTAKVSLDGDSTFLGAVRLA